MVQMAWMDRDGLCESASRWSGVGSRRKSEEMESGARLFGVHVRASSPCLAPLVWTLSLQVDWI